MRACLVLLPIASLAFGLAKYLEDEGSPEEQSIYDDFPRRRLIRGFENIVLSHTQSENVTNWVAYFCGNVSEYRTAFREGIKSSWTRQRLEDFDIPDLKLMNDDEEEENKFKDCKANIGKLIDPVQAKALREYVDQFCEDVDAHRQRGTVKPSKTIKQLESFAIENLELMDEKTIMKFKKCEADVDELVKITTTTSTISSTTPAEPLTTTWMSTATEIPVTTSTEAPTTKTTSKAATTTELETTRYTFQTTTKTGATSTFEKPAFWPWDTYRPLESEKKGKPVAETNTATVTPETVMGAMEISLLASLGSLLLVCIICTIIVVIFCMCFAEDMPPVVEQWDPEVNYAPSYTVIVSENAVEPAEQKNSVKCIPNDASSQAPSDTTISKAEIVQPAKTRKKKYPV